MEGQPQAGKPVLQIEAHLTIGEILRELSKGADGVLWREQGGFRR